MVTMHYPPESANDLLLATTDPKNPCLFLIYSKLGLSSDAPTEHLCWTERVYLQTSTKLRAQNKTRPYDVAYARSDIDRCLELNREIDSRAAYNARLMVNK